MTFKEKLMQEHSELDIDAEIWNRCPRFYDYEEGYHCDTADNDCPQCWNREVPEEETT